MGSKRALNLVALLDFYDRMVPESVGHANAINALMGEEFASSLFLDFAERKNLRPTIVSDVCTQGTKKGKRLDRWIQIIENDKTIYFQTEIKNWSAHSISGQKTPLTESEEDLIPYRIARWETQFDTDANVLRQEPANKVLIKMRAPIVNVEIRPLIIFWDSMHPDGSPNPFFSVKVDSSSFELLWIFSMSTYVRNLINEGISEINVEMPGVVERLNWLEVLLKK
jgi:hypothetical protein